MTVAELITFLQTQPQDIPVAYQLYSEQCLLETEHIRLAQLQPVREDGWIHHARPDKPVLTYLLFPGN